MYQSTLNRVRCSKPRPIEGLMSTGLSSWLHDRVNAAADKAERKMRFTATTRPRRCQARQQDIEAEIHAGKHHVKTISPSSSPVCPQLWEARVIDRLRLTHASLSTAPLSPSSLLPSNRGLRLSSHCVIAPVCRGCLRQHWIQDWVHLRHVAACPQEPCAHRRQHHRHHVPAFRGRELPVHETLPASCHSTYKGLLFLLTNIWQKPATTPNTM